MRDDEDLQTFLGACGPCIDVDALELPKAQALARILQSRDDLGATLTEVRSSPTYEWLITRLDVDVGQLPAEDIRREEMLAIGFSRKDDDWPAAVALRSDFPDRVSHIFVGQPGQLVRLCLSEEPWVEAKRRWTPAGLISLIRMWLIETARGALHRDEQNLEPFILGGSGAVILPRDVFSGGNLMLIGEETGGIVPSGLRTYRFRKAGRNEAAGGSHLVAGTFMPPARVHGTIHRNPATVADLSILLDTDDYSFTRLLEGFIQQWMKGKALNAHVAFFIALRVTRTPGGEVERTDYLTFFSAATVRELAAAFDIANSDPDGALGLLLSSQRRPGPYGSEIGLDVFTPVFEVGPDEAAGYNGLTGTSGRNIVAVGAGALGSQVIGNLLRMGENVAAIVDEDQLFPHNLARHAIIDHEALGRPKAPAVAAWAGQLFPHRASPEAFTVNAAAPSADEGYQRALQGADLILDMAASVAVSRHLAIDERMAGRRVAAFLSPMGHDLVVIAEDAERRIPLDHLEMNYYAALVGSRALDDHLLLPAGVRYARGCRDVSMQLSQAHVAIHAGIASDRIRQMDDNASATVWRFDAVTLAVTPIPLDCRPMHSFNAGSWTVLLAPALLDRLHAQRLAKLPVETGGVLIGDFDIERKRVYLVTTLATPADSKESATTFVRGAFGVDEELQQVATRTLGMLRYAGEWHSHPAGHSPAPSGDDLALYQHLRDAMEVEGYPPVMLIVADLTFGLVVDGDFQSIEGGTV